MPVIDTSPGPNGAYEDAYADPIHFTRIGRERLAGQVFARLRPLLEVSSARCRPRDQAIEQRKDGGQDQHVDGPGER